MSAIEVKAPEDVTSREDFISCAPYKCRLTASACVGRRSLVMARNQSMSACFACPVGPVVEKNSGGALPASVLEAASKSSFNWAFGGFARGLARSKAAAKSAPAKAPAPKPAKNAITASPVPPPAKEKDNMSECKKCSRPLRARRLDTPVPVGLEELCNECRRKITRRKPKAVAAPVEPEILVEVEEAPKPPIKVVKPPPKKARPKSKRKPRREKPAPVSGILKARDPDVRPAAYVARALLPTADDRTLAELKEAITLVDAIGWDEARALARRFQQAAPLRHVS